MVTTLHKVLVPTLHHELRSSPVRVSGLQPRPMRTPLRARAFTHETDYVPVDPAACADACVQLLAADAGSSDWMRPQDPAVDTAAGDASDAAPARVG